MDTAKTSLFTQALTFDDILLLPSYTDFTRNDIDTTTYVTKKVKIKTPFVSAPMDTVTEEKMAIALAQNGAIGIIHRNLTIDSQAKKIKKVKEKNLLVGAATAPGKDFIKRTDSLVKAGADIIVIDTAHGYTKTIIEATKYLKTKYPKIQIMAGNIATTEAAKALIAAGADGLRVGMGPGSICTTRVISGMGVPQVTAIKNVVKAAKSKNIPVTADGGVRLSGDIIKALALGASTVMMGSFFAACKESPGKTIKLKKSQVPHRFLSIFNGKKKIVEFKEYRGMGSEEAMKKGAKLKSGSEFHGKDYYKERVLVSEGVAGLVPSRGPVKNIIDQAMGGVKSGMYYIGTKTIPEMWKNAQFVQITSASLTENHPHNLVIVNPGDNYRS